MKVVLKEGQAVVLPREGKSFDPTLIPKAVRDAGFSPGEIELVAVGVLSREDGFLLLETSGPVPKFVLAAGTKVEELKARAALLGKKLRVTGKLHPSHADRPPGLTVEGWTVREATEAKGR